MNGRLKKFQCSPRSLLAVGLTAWGSAVMAGTLHLVRYSNTPGPAADNTPQWPAGEAIPRSNDRAQLVMCLLPQCPCSRASLNELEVLIAKCHGKLSAAVLFVDAANSTEDITTTESWQTASRIPDVTPIRDQKGKLSSLFHAKTSGQIFLYDSNSALRFSGGITDSRGHAGDNDGLSAIEAILNHAAPTTTNTPVYGCSLR